MTDAWQKELKEKKETGQAVELVVLQGRKALRCLFIRTDTEKIIEQTDYDLVIKFTSANLVHFISRPAREIDLTNLLIMLRIDEARQMKVPFDKINKKLLGSPEPHPAIGKWQLVQKKAAIHNLQPTSLQPFQLKHDLRIGLGNFNLTEECPLTDCEDKNCSWQAYQLMLSHRPVQAEINKKYSVTKNKEIPFDQKWSEFKPADLVEFENKDILEKMVDFKFE